MTETRKASDYSVYFKTWLILLVLTVMMVAIDRLRLPRAALVLVLVLAMLMKASLIGANFMHLRWERWGLVLLVALGLLLTGAALFFGIAPDGVRALRLAP
jgi:caa(3)-type oxidase subunit IV